MPVLILTFFFFCGQGLYFVSLSPYILSHYQDNAPQIFLAGQLAMPAGFFFAGYISDRTRCLRALLLTGIVLQVPMQFLFYSAAEMWTNQGTEITFLLSAALRFIFAYNMQLLTLVILEARGESNFGSTRLWGTVAFLITNTAVYLFSDSQILPECTGKYGAFVFFLCLPVAFMVPVYRKSEQEYHFRKALLLLKNARVRNFFLICALYILNYQLEDFYLGRFIQEKGSMQEVFLAWSLAVVLEIPAMLLAHPLQKRGGVRLLFSIAILASSLRFTWLALAAAGWAGSFALSHLLHGIMFTFFYLGYIFQLKRIFPEHLYGTGMGLFMILAISTGAIAGNLGYGSVLFNGSLKQALATALPAASPYFLLFAPAAAMMLLLLPALHILSGDTGDKKKA